MCLPAERFGGGLAVCSCLHWPLVFALRHPQKAIGPLILFVLGGACSAGPSCLIRWLCRPTWDCRNCSEGPKLWSLTRSALHSDAVHEWMESRAYLLQSVHFPSLPVPGSGYSYGRFGSDERGGWAVSSYRRWDCLSLARHPRKGAAPLVLVHDGLLVAAVPAIYTLCVPAGSWSAR